MKVFFYNPSTKTSIWERPHELKNRADVDKMLKAPGGDEAKVPDASGNESEPVNRNEQKREATGVEEHPPVCVKKAK